MSAPRPTDALAEAMGCFVAAVRRRGSPAPVGADVLDALREPFRALLDVGSLLGELLDDTRDEAVVHLLHRSSAVTVFAIAAPPGYRSPIHDHGVWGLVGQAAGAERETRFVTTSDGSGPGPSIGLWPAESQVLRPGDVVTLLPDDAGHAGGHDVHQVATIGRHVSLTVHAFGRDIVRGGFSVFSPTAYAREPFVGSFHNDAGPD